MDKAESHARAGSQAGVETMGLLVGNFCKYRGRDWVLVEDYVTAENKSSSVSVRFSKESFGSLSQKLSDPIRGKKVVVGWLHSHPGLDCFLSYIDIDTQMTYFDHPLSIAAVVDPSKPGESAGMKKRVYRLAGDEGKYGEVSFAVVSD